MMPPVNPLMTDPHAENQTPPESGKGTAGAGGFRNLIEWGVIIVVAVVFAFVVRGLVFQTFFIPSESMVPKLEINDRILVNKLAYDFGDPERGDVECSRLHRTLKSAGWTTS